MFPWQVSKISIITGDQCTVKLILCINSMLRSALDFSKSLAQSGIEALNRPTQPHAGMRLKPILPQSEGTFLIYVANFIFSIKLRLTQQPIDLYELLGECAARASKHCFPLTIPFLIKVEHKISLCNVFHGISNVFEAHLLFYRICVTCHRFY